MKIEDNDTGELKECKSFRLTTITHEPFDINIHDTGFEFKYGGNWYSCYEGLVTKMMFSPDEQETKKKKG